MTGERVDRRQFMRRAGLAAAALGTTSILGSAAACGTGGRPASRTTATGTRQPGPVDWPSLGSSLAGTLVLPVDPSYGSDKVLYNERFDAVAPAALAYCQTAADVQRCVTFARAHGVHVAARSGGHSYGGYSTTSGLVVDVSRLDAVAPAPSSATVGAGAQLIDLYATLGNAGRLVPGGSCPTSQFLSQGAAGPGSGLITKVTGVYAGTPTACTAALRPLLASVGSTPTDEFVGPETYLRAMFIEAGCEGDTLDRCQLPSRNPQWILSRSAFAAKSSFIDSALPPAGAPTALPGAARAARDRE